MSTEAWADHELGNELDDALNTAEHARIWIRSLIVNGRLAARTPLREGDLAERIGVSRTPVREALRLLAAEGLVEIRPNRGAVVSELAGAASEELAEVRAILEGAAARLAAPRITSSELAQLRELDKQMRALARTGTNDSLDQIARLNWDFHLIVRQAAGNRSLETLVNGLSYVPLARRTFRYYSEEAVERSMSRHAELIAALSVRNAEWAESVMRSHVWAAASTQRYGPEEDVTTDLNLPD